MPVAELYFSHLTFPIYQRFGPKLVPRGKVTLLIFSIELSWAARSKLSLMCTSPENYPAQPNRRLLLCVIFSVLSTYNLTFAFFITESPPAAWWPRRFDLDGEESRQSEAGHQDLLADSVLHSGWSFFL